MLHGFPYEGFTGLVLVDQATPDRPGSVDGQDMELTPQFMLQTRGGTEAWTGDLGTNGHLRGLHFTRAGADALLAFSEIGIFAFGMDGQQLAFIAHDHQNVMPDFVDVAQPGVESTFVLCGEEWVRYLNGAFDAPDITFDNSTDSPGPEATVGGVTPWDNRMVVGGFLGDQDGPGGSATNPSRIYVSAPGDPLTWDTTWREDLRPGDGDKITAIQAWRDRLFVFKERSFYSFYGTSVSSSGGVTMEYIPVDSGVGCVGPQAVCAHRDGVYFADRSGIYKTTGDDPELVSGSIDPMFGAGSSIYFKGDLIDATQMPSMVMESMDERIYISFSSQTQRRMIIYEPRFDWWQYWSLCAFGMAATEFVPHHAELAVDCGGQIFKQSAAFDDDDGTPINSHWQSEWMTMGQDATKVTRMARIWGMGDMTMSYAGDYGSLEFAGEIHLNSAEDDWSDGSNPDDLWREGDDPTDLWSSGYGFGDGWVRRAIRGTALSFQVQSIDGSRIKVQRVNHLLTGSRRDAYDTQSIGAM